MRIQAAAIPVVILLGWCIVACTPTFSSKFAGPDDIIRLSPKDPAAIGSRSSCDTIAYYAPDTLHPDHRPPYQIRVNFHFMNSSDLRNNIPEEDQVKYVRDFLWLLNKSLETNAKMLLPRENETPALPIPFRYVLTSNPDVPGDDGIYQHIDDELYFFVKKGKHRNNTDRRVIRKYAIRDDSVLNMFFMPHHPDSVASPTYRADGSGIALGTSIKLAGQWIKKPDQWGTKGLIHHEVGHVLGLRHTWNANDGCADTPRHPNCYNISDKPPCDSLYSNNVMDYNAQQGAWTPCQLGKIIRNFSLLDSKQRNLLKPTWCTKKQDKTIVIDDRVHWYAARDIDADVLIGEAGELTIHCRTSIPRDGKITVAPGGRLILDGALLHNSCGDQWQGIEIQSRGKAAGEVIFLGTPRIEDTPFVFDETRD